MNGRVICLCVLVGVVGYASSQAVHFKGDKVLRLIPRDLHQVKVLRHLVDHDALDFWTDVTRPGVAVDVHVPQDQLQSFIKLMQKNEITFSILIADLEQEVQRESVSMKTQHTYSDRFDYETYNRLADIQREVRRMASVHSDIASTFSVGKSYEKREMLGIKISSGKSKPAIWIDGCIHAREWISCASVMYLLKMLLQPEPRFASKVASVLSKYDFYILPVFNVDGYEYSHTTNRMWRKTRSKGYWCKGADPNRNWNSKWGGEGTSPYECSDIYHGKAPFSEIEVKQVARMLMNLKKSVGLKSYWNVHAYSQLVLYPWSYTKDKTPDQEEIARVAKVFVNGVSKSSGKLFTAGQPSRILYPVAGGSMDWTYEKLGVIYSYAPELRPAQREMTNGFMLPAKFIRPSGLEFTNGLLDAVLAMK